MLVVLGWQAFTLLSNELFQIQVPPVHGSGAAWDKLDGGASNWPEAVADGLAAAAKDGNCLSVGVCGFSEPEMRRAAKKLRDAHRIPLATNQAEFSLVSQAPLKSGLLKACKELGILLLASAPLAMGRLTDRYFQSGLLEDGHPSPPWGELGGRPRGEARLVRRPGSVDPD